MINIGDLVRVVMIHPKDLDGAKGSTREYYLSLIGNIYEVVGLDPDGFHQYDLEVDDRVLGFNHIEVELAYTK